MNKETVANILIVDDNTDSLEVMCEYFIKKGYNTFKASCAEDSLDLMKTNPVDVAIVDIVLPEMNGLELTDSIRKSYETDVIVITGYGDDYSYEEAISKGASDFVFKPIRVKELDLRLKRVLKERKLKNERFYPESQQEIAVTISIGSTEYSPGEDISSFVKRSDKAMYISKQEGRDKVTCLNA